MYPLSFHSHLVYLDVGSNSLAFVRQDPGDSLQQRQALSGHVDHHAISDVATANWASTSFIIAMPRSEDAANDTVLVQNTMDPFKATREARAYFSLLPSCQMIQEKCKAVTCPKATSE